jgi:hemerythrin-like domain-containing protein
MLATRGLRAEHVEVIRMLDVLDVMAERARAGRSPDMSDFREAFEFLTLFLDRCHHTKEEIVLFPAVVRVGIMDDESPVENLIEEHERGRALVVRFGTIADDLAAVPEEAIKEFADVVSEYSTLFRGHIAAEEADCFDPADERLSSVVQEALAEEYERVEREVLGAKRHEQLLSIIDRLEVVYIQTAS